MEYLVFPFGKYKGEKLEDLPSTYIVLALEKFELPHELKDKLIKIILGRFKIYSRFNAILNDLNMEEYRGFLTEMSMSYEPTPF